MKNQLFLLLTVLTAFNSFAQIDLEKGYFINNSNVKTECFIKNIDWLDNPVEFEYKLTPESGYISAKINSVKEFGIYDKSKYIRAKVAMDRSSTKAAELSISKIPVFKEEELFLKILVEGKANLYEYIDGNLTRYFYSKDNSIISQLIYKQYQEKIEIRVREFKDVVSENNLYKQQLWNELKCESFSSNRFKNLNYKKKDLVDLFIDYSNCNNEKIDIIKKTDEKKGNYNLTLRPRLNSSSLNVDNKSKDNKDTQFDTKTILGFGIELEYIFPFNNNKWSFAVEPTYQSYKSEKSSTVNDPYDGILTREIDYKSVEIPISIRHYMPLSTCSKIFLEASFVTNLKLKSSLEYYINGISMSPVLINTKNNVAFGIGYKYNDKFSLQLRFQTNREILGNQPNWSSAYQSSSVILGYTIF